jgi:hypothetical protein
MTIYCPNGFISIAKIHFHIFPAEPKNTLTHVHRNATNPKNVCFVKYKHFSGLLVIRGMNSETVYTIAA